MVFSNLLEKDFFKIDVAKRQEDFYAKRDITLEIAAIAKVSALRSKDLRILENPPVVFL